MKRRNLLLACFTATVLGFAGSLPAIADTVTTRVKVAPPAPREETIPPGPNYHAYWIPGYWEWNGRDFAWEGGHWEGDRPGMAYRQAYWIKNDGYWEFHPGEWVTVDTLAPTTVAATTTADVITVAPPPPRVEVVPAAPGPDFIWISGLWVWGGGHYAWHPGHWTTARVGYVWAPAHWARYGGGWRLEGGYWHHHR
jgi:hypothetical protein